jgi:hypothetical protein
MLGAVQCCALGLGRLGLETSRDVARSRLGLVSKKFADVSVSGLDVSISAIYLAVLAKAATSSYYSH